MEQYIFALDIGTRSVVGVIAEEIDKQLTIIASDVEEHENRSMMDGQIHDIEEVAAVVKRIKTRLEAQINKPIKRVAVAAAGRALKTLTASVEEDISELLEVTKEDVLGLELEAVQLAQRKILDLKDEDNSKYHCVGYSVINYGLDGMKIGSLVGQQGQKFSVEIVATFLPRVVVDSLFAVLKRADLEMTSLTLEPIAASHVVIPQNMRMLNIALVDIGAGTSDIALTAGGSIVGYAMVPYAGDEITEEISHQFLLDFDVAEKVKRLMIKNERVDFIDILGVEHSLDTDEIIEAILPKIETLAFEISDKIVELNNKSPQAVICIGGGSLTPKLTEKIAEKLELSEQRVAVRGREIVTSVFGDTGLNGPDSITPLGIAYTAYKHKGLGFANVIVNGKQIRFFEINQGTVGDALLAAGIEIKRLYGRPGMALTVKVNGNIKIIKGGQGTPGQIKLNGDVTHLDSFVHDNDKIEVIDALDGLAAKGTIKDVIPECTSLNIFINGTEKVVEPIITMNHIRVNINEPLVDGAEIYFQEIKNIEDALEALDWREFPHNWVIRKNGLIHSLSDAIIQGDKIQIEAIEHISSIDNLQEEQSLTLTYQTCLENEEIEVTRKRGIDKELTDYDSSNKYANNNNHDNDDSDNDNDDSDISDDSDEVEALYRTTVFVNGDKVVIQRKNGDLIFTDIFPYLKGFEAKPPKIGAVLVMQVNGIKAEFTTPLKNNDRIQLYWKN